ncbi:MAG: JAB domain-containing protein [Bacteroidetes bacterium]|nr:JAB domain-containing protein [Bacteroidota bacterium]
MLQQSTNLFSVTEVELTYRNKSKASERRQIITSKDAYDLLIQSWDMNKIDLVEQFKIILLDRRNSCMGVSTISTGGVTGVVVDPKIIFATALKARATGLVLAHNHPSGNLKPSSEDLSLTKKLKQGGGFLDISIFDHLILTTESYASFADEGLMP